MSHLWFGGLPSAHNNPLIKQTIATVFFLCAILGHKKTTNKNWPAFFQLLLYSKILLKGSYLGWRWPCRIAFFVMVGASVFGEEELHNDIYTSGMFKYYVNRISSNFQCWSSALLIAIILCSFSIYYGIVILSGLYASIPMIWPIWENTCNALPFKTAKHVWAFQSQCSQI